jgi:uncharacterized protein
MERRTFLTGSLAVVGSSALSQLFRNQPAAAASGFRIGAAATANDGPYGPLLEPNTDGIQLPAGFTSRIIGTTGKTVGSSKYTWHTAPDGGSCFATPDGGWVYVSNSEDRTTGKGGVGAVKFDRGANIVDAYGILSVTTANCAGGLTPWGTWLSGEENGAAGNIYECDPLKPGQGRKRAAMGAFAHEAAAVDTRTGYVYMTEDDPNGRLYQFRPDRRNNLSSGKLYAATVTKGKLGWVVASADEPDRQPSTAIFHGTEGIWIDGDRMVFTTKHDVLVWKVQLRAQTISVLYSSKASPKGALNAVDNITIHHPSNDIYVAEDGGNLELCVLRELKGGVEVSPFLRFVGHDDSEVTGPAFSPDNKRLYVSSQRGTDGVTGMTFEISGPFRTTK